MSSLSFPTKDMKVLIIAVFSIAISIGLSQVSSVNAVESSDTAESEVTVDNEDTKNESESVVNTSTGGPAIASPDDNIIKPINLNKGSTSDEPLQTNKAKQQGLEKIITDKEVNKNNNNLNQNQKQGMNLDKYSSMSELYQSFDLPYTALYKTPN